MPKYYGLGRVDNDYYIRLENLITEKSNVAFMDIKIGTRTFSESMALPKEEGNIKRRKEYLEDMMEKEPSAPTYEELRGR